MERTEAKNTEAALRESEARFRAVVNMVPDLLWSNDASGYTDWYNQSWLDYTGQTLDEACGYGWLQAIHPDDVDRVRRSFQQAVDSGQDLRHEQRIRRHDGHYRWFLVQARPLKEGNGHIGRWFGAATNIHRERREREALLRDSEERARALISNLPGGAVFILDHDLRYTLAEGEALRQLKKCPSDFVGRTLFETVPPELATQMEGQLRQVLNGHTFDEERDMGGQTFLSRGVPLRDDNGHVTHALVVSYNITQRKQAEAALRESGERFRAMFEQATAGVAEYALDGKHTFANDTFQQWLGYSSLELRELRLRDITHPDDVALCRELFERAKATGGSFLSEKRLVRKNGDIVWITNSISGIRDASGQTHSVVVVSIDITQRKHAEEELQRAHDELEGRVARRTRELALALERVNTEVEQRRVAEAGRLELMKRIVNTQEEERGRISRELHDNLGQHLTAVMLGLHALELQMEALQGDKEVPRLDTLRGLVDGLMKAAHRQAWELRPAELDAMGLEAALGQYIRDWSGRTQVPVDFHALGWEQRPEKAVETALYRVVQEALTNVARHAQAQHVGVIIEQNKERVMAIVEDDGQGFDPEVSSGARLGVMGMRERLALVGGTLELESAPGQGTTVFARVARQHTTDDAKEGAV